MSKNRNVLIKGVPSDLGANIRGSNIGPAAARIAGLKSSIEQIGYTVHDYGDIAVPVRDELAVDVVDSKFLDPIANLCTDLANVCYNGMKNQQMPIVLGGDHSLAIGSISGVSKFYQEQQQDFGLIWVDAHADINSPSSSESGNIHGMPLATLLGNGHPTLTSIMFNGAKVKPQKTALIGIRMIDQREKELLKESGISYFSMREIDERGMFDVMKEVIAITTDGTSGIHLSFDIDGIDPMYAPGVSTPVPGGLSFREAHLLLEMIAETGKLNSMEFVELNPFTDVGAQSAKLLVELVLSALGKSIV